MFLIVWVEQNLAGGVRLKCNLPLLYGRCQEFAEGMGHGVTRHYKEGDRSQESEFRRKAIKFEFSQLLATDYWLLDSLIAD
jgi:hypothetical protein